jgi:hypothetical protein
VGAERYDRPLELIRLVVEYLERSTSCSPGSFWQLSIAMATPRYRATAHHPTTHATSPHHVPRLAPPPPPAPAPSYSSLPSSAYLLGDAVPRRVMAIGPGTKVEISTARAHAFSLKLRGSDDVVVLAAQDARQRAEWVVTLSTVVAQQEKFQRSVVKFNRHRQQQASLSVLADEGGRDAEADGILFVVRYLEGHHLGARQLFSALEASLEYAESMEPRKMDKLQVCVCVCGGGGVAACVCVCLWGEK